MPIHPPATRRRTQPANKALVVGSLARRMVTARRSDEGKRVAALLFARLAEPFKAEYTKSCLLDVVGCYHSQCGPFHTRLASRAHLRPVS